ncbi:MAG: iron-containing alcohol dehydrogenase, partial [Clostridia bacterium]|nr:iron-containing alcohol dehydrogenase [Clostridia bacterium]
MTNFDFYAPTYFVFGRNREAEVATYVKKFGGSRVMVIYGGQSAKRSGLIDRVNASLDAAEIFHIEMGGVKPNPRSGFVYEGIE